MNLEKELILKPESPTVHVIRKTSNIKYFSIGLVKGQILKEHKTPVPTTLTVLKGSINFRFGDLDHHLDQFDVFEIPVNELHEVHGLGEENIFTLIQEL